MDLANNKISAKTLERVQIAKSYIEKKYKMKKETEENKKEGIISFIKNGTKSIKRWRK
jgi:hypothetical protein